MVDPGRALGAGEIAPLRLARDDDRARPHDGKLLGCDQLTGRSECVRVVECDVREHDHRSVDDVGRVVTAAEPGFDGCDLDAACGEIGERGRGDRLELGRSDRLGIRPDARDRALESVAVGVEPLVPAAHVRREI
jgi:hypothetical protein